MLRSPGTYRPQVDVTIRNVHGEHAVGLQMLEVQLERFVGEQVRRDRAAGKGIDGQEVELLRRLSLQRQPRVAEKNVEICAGVPGIGKECEVLSGDIDDVR